MFNNLIVLIVIFAINLIIVNSQSNEIDLQCIDCICKATGKCEYPLGCSNVGSGYYCGPLQISWAYWADAGKLNDFGNRHDFEDCLTTKECAEHTMQNYMRKYAQDCNGDGIIDCKDFAILHKTGFRQCQKSVIENTKYWKDFTKTQCFRSGNRINQPNTISRNRSNVVRNVFHSTSSTSVRNVRRTITNNDNNFNSINERFNRFKEDFNSNNNFNNRENHFNNGHNFNELIVETNRPARSAARINVLNRNNNNFNLENSQPIRKPIPQPENESPNNSIRVITINGNVKPINLINNHNSQPVFNDNNLKLSNATVTIDSKCLDCICYGSTKCNLKTKCNSNFCGPFLISYSYWVDGGSLNNYIDCSNDFNCAKQTVANYMARHNKDCDLNRELTCDDFALIHQTGAYQCEKNLNVKISHYWVNYQKCYYNDDFHIFSNDDESVTGFSIVSNSIKPEQPLNSINSNQIDPRNRPRNLPTEINLTNDWRPIESNGNSLKPVEPIINNNLRPNSLPSNNAFNQPRPINQPSFNNDQPRPINQPSSSNNLRPVNQPPLNNNNPDWIENVNNEESTEENINNSNNNNPNSNQPLSRSTRKPLNRPPPRRFERPATENINNDSNNEDEEISEQPNVEPPNNLNSYNSRSNSNDFVHEIVPIENNRNTPRTASLVRSNVIPVDPNSPLTTNIKKNNVTISQSCLDCICEATSGNCLEKANCFVNNFGELVCGPYKINRFFWQDAVGPETFKEEFEQCASNRICSQKIIISYISKYATDCNNDEEINCMDFAAMVKAGKKACNLSNLIDSNYWNKFQQCYGFGDD